MRDNLHSGPRIISGAADALKLKPEPWTERALCVQTDPEIFFPDQGGSTHQAKRVCSRCEVRDECLEWAVRNGEAYGILGGMSARQRRPLERDLREKEAG